MKANSADLCGSEPRNKLYFTQNEICWEPLSTGETRNLLFTHMKQCHVIIKESVFHSTVIFNHVKQWHISE